MYQPARFMRFRALFVMFGLAGLLLSAPAAVARPASAAPAAGAGLNWRQYLQGPQHSSVSLATAFTPSNAASASQVLALAAAGRNGQAAAPPGGQPDRGGWPGVYRR